MNSCCFVGRLTNDPELKKTSNDVSVCSFRLAVNRPRVKDATDFIDFVAWRGSAEYLTKYARKGSLVAVSGALTSRNYEDKQGNKRTAFEVVADNVTLCESKTREAAASVEPTFATQNADFEVVEVDEDTLPF
jgi:single-strand DNA-binding protein